MSYVSSCACFEGGYSPSVGGTAVVTLDTVVHRDAAPTMCAAALALNYAPAMLLRCLRSLPYVPVVQQ